jgi:hypothetical protein
LPLKKIAVRRLGYPPTRRISLAVNRLRTLKLACDPIAIELMCQSAAHHALGAIVEFSVRSLRATGVNNLSTPKSLGGELEIRPAVLGFRGIRYGTTGESPIHKASRKLNITGVGLGVIANTRKQPPR